MLDHLLLQRVLANCGSTKNAFVPMPGGQAEPVAGASQATAAMGAPLGSPPGGPAPQPAQGGQPPAQGGGGGMPPEVQEMLADPNVQQMLQQAGFAIDPSSGNVIDPAIQSDSSSASGADEAPDVRHGMVRLRNAKSEVFPRTLG